MTLSRVWKSHALVALGLALLGAPAQARPPQGKEPAQFTLRVPPGAQVWFGGAATTSTGATRVFDSPPLPPGRSYRYQVRVRWQEGGRPVERTRLVTFRAGDQLTLDFGATTVRSYLEPRAPAARAATPAAPAVTPTPSSVPAYYSAPAPSDSPAPSQWYSGDGINYLGSGG
jgi:uncharacterized protein (TIGR03000 family)